MKLSRKQPAPARGPSDQAVWSATLGTKGSPGHGQLAASVQLVTDPPSPRRRPLRVARRRAPGSAGYVTNFFHHDCAARRAVGQPALARSVQHPPGAA